MNKPSPRLSRPSSTITAAGLTGMAMTVLWGLVFTFFPEFKAHPTLISGSTAFAAALFGYLKPERVLK
jgi:hypothetical protein